MRAQLLHCYFQLEFLINIGPTTFSTEITKYSRTWLISKHCMVRPDFHKNPYKRSLANKLPNLESVGVLLEQLDFITCLLKDEPVPERSESIG